MNEALISKLTTLDYFNDNTRLCIHQDTHKLYVVKQVPVQAAEYYVRIAALDSPNLAKISAVEYRQNGVFISRSYISGDCLSDLVDQGKLFTEDQAARIGCDVCRGLAALHDAGFVHRDINPNNVILTENGTAIIIDYGIVRSFTSPKSSDTQIMGTSNYAAPEQFGFQQSDDKTDIYALGVMLNVLITGKFPSETTAGGNMRKIIRRCTQMDKTRRDKDIRQLLRALSPLCDDRLRHTDKTLFWRIIDLIPGFRSKNPMWAIIAFAGYSVMMLGTYGLCFPAEGTSPWSIFIGFLTSVFFLYIPVALFTNFGYFRDRMPFSSDLPRWAQIILCFVLSFISIIVSLIIYSHV